MPTTKSFPHRRVWGSLNREMSHEQIPAGQKEGRNAIRFWSFSTLLMAMFVAGFAAQQYIIVYKGKPYETYLALNAYGMKSWYLWELLTFQGLHSNGIHLLVNLIGLWFLGRAVESKLGWKTFLAVYLGAGLVGGLLQGSLAMVANFVPPSLDAVAKYLLDQFGNPTAGSSAGLCGVLAVLCRLQPDAPFRFGVTLPLKGRHLLWGVGGILAFFAVVPFGTSQPNDLESQSMWLAIWWAPISLAHAAHVGGLFAGVWFVKLGLHQKLG